MLTETTRTLRRAGKLAAIARASRRVQQSTESASRRAAQARLAELLADARGVSMKVGQLFTTGRADEALSPLVTGIEPMPQELAVEQIQRGFGCPIQELFSEFSVHACAASLGQVHRATTRDGRRVAVKVQYPDIRDCVHAELKLLGLLPGLGPVKKWGFDLSGYRQVLQADLDQELDYRSEAERQQAFAHAVRVRGLVVPHVSPEECSEIVLVQEWCEGLALAQVEDEPLPVRTAFARILLETLLCSLFSAGMVHADPNPGNYRFVADPRAPRVVLFDFGSVVAVDERARLALLKLILALREGTEIDVRAAWVAAGFDQDKLSHVEPALGDLSRALFKPFLTDGAFELESWELSAAFEQLLGELKWWFRAAGPPELFLLLRAFQGVTQQLKMLRVKLPWFAVLKRAAGESFERARQLTLPTLPGSDARPLRGRAKFLKVEVCTGSEEPKLLSFPASAALELSALVPDDVRSSLEQQGISVQELQQRLQRDGLSPQMLFCRMDGPNCYRVWLQ